MIQLRVYRRAVIYTGKLTDHSHEIIAALKDRVPVAFNATGTQAEAYAKISEK